MIYKKYLTQVASSRITNAMGLLFALQPFEERSDAATLHLRSHFRKFAMGGSFFFAGMFLGVMTLAAFPLFKLMLAEGGIFDKLIVGFFVTVLILYPILGAICFLFEEHVVLEKTPQGLFNLNSYQQLVFLKWHKKKLEGFKLEDLKEENWVGLLNAAALESKSKNHKPNRYATKGHWLLTLKKPNGDTHVIERRAKKEEIEWLKFLIEKHFHQ